MINKETLTDLVSFRKELDSSLIKNKITPVNFSYRTYFYIRQNRMKFVKKAHDVYSVLFNYYFWLARIERRVMIERELYSINPNIASAEKLEEINFFFNRRKNQMVRRLLVEFESDIKIKKAQLVYKDKVELLIEIDDSEFFIYVNKEVLDRLGVDILPLGRTSRTFYLPYMFFDLPLELK